MTVCKAENNYCEMKMDCLLMQQYFVQNITERVLINEAFWVLRTREVFDSLKWILTSLE